MVVAVVGVLGPASVAAAWSLTSPLTSVVAGFLAKGEEEAE